MGSNPKKYYNVRSYSELRSKLLGDKYTECEPGRSVEKWGTLGCPVQFSGYEVHKDRLGRSTEVVVFWRKCKNGPLNGRVNEYNVCGNERRPWANIKLEVDAIDYRNYEAEFKNFAMAAIGIATAGAAIWATASKIWGSSAPKDAGPFEGRRAAVVEEVESDDEDSDEKRYAAPPPQASSAPNFTAPPPQHPQHMPYPFPQAPGPSFYYTYPGQPQFMSQAFAAPPPQAQHAGADTESTVSDWTTYPPLHSSELRGLE